MVIASIVLGLFILGTATRAQTTITCKSTYPYRSANGSCNNLANPNYGMSQTVYQRLLASSYSDGTGAIQVSVSGNPLPSPRLVSTTVVTNETRPDYDVSLFMMLWGQWIEQDLSLPSKPNSNKGTPINCCTGTNFLGTPVNPSPSTECATIAIPSNDPVYNSGGSSSNTCMNYVRTSYQFQYLGGGTAPDRQQINNNTHWLDGSQIYGSSDAVAKSLRNPASGKGQLLTSTDTLGRVLPPWNIPANCLNYNLCYLTGDFGASRATNNPLITIMHTLWIREHNRVAKQIALAKPGQTDEYYYQEARRVVIAELQHITYTEYLPILIGEDMTDKIMTTITTSDDYFSPVNPNIYSEWAAGAGLAYHSMIKGFVRLYEASGALSNQSYFTGNVYNGPAVLSKMYTTNFIDNALRGLLKTPVQSVDSYLPDDVTSQYEKLSGQKLGLDLVALDIQAGRDHGLTAYINALIYNQINQLNGGNYFFPSSNIFNPDTPADVIQSWGQVYSDPSDVDLFIGGVTEKPQNGALLGPTFATIVAKQFDVLKHADRFFYNNPYQNVSFTSTQISEIQKVSLARILCDNSDGTVTTVQPNVFRMPNQHNGLNKAVSCSKIPGINFSTLMAGM